MMDNYKYIIVPMKITEQSANVFRHACKIAGEMKYNIRLMYCESHEKRCLPLTCLSNEKANEIIRSGITSFAEKISGEMNLKVDTVFVSGGYYENIMYYASDPEANFVFIPARPVHNEDFRKVLSARKRLHFKSPCPVLSFKNEFPSNTYRSAVLPLEAASSLLPDFSKVSEFACGNNIHLKILICIDGKITPENISELEKRVFQVNQTLRDTGMEYSTAFLEMKKGKSFAPEYLDEYIRKAGDIDLLILPVDNKRSEESAAYRYCCERLLTLSDIPVMTVVAA